MSDALMGLQPAPRCRHAVPHYRGPRLQLPPHADAPDPDDEREVRRWVRRAVGPTAIDLFCGAGGLSLGLRDAGFTVLVGADMDPFSVETHRSNIGGLGYLGDLADPGHFLSRLKSWGIHRVDLVAGGVPCQPFSRAGRSKIRSLVQTGIRPAEDSRTTLWRSFVKIVEALHPRAVLIENVPDLAMWDEGTLLTEIRESLRSAGYATSARVINAFEQGVPQHRARLFVAGSRSGRALEWPEPQGHCTVRDAIGDLPVVPPAQREDVLPYDGPQTHLQLRMRSGVPPEDSHLVHDHVTRDVRPDDAEAFSLLRAGQTYADLPRHLRRYRSDIFTDKYNRLKWNALSRTITAHISRDGYWYIHPEQHRTLSIREAARIQTFPDWFRFAGRPSHQYRQIGNAVPPLLAESIGRKLREMLSKRGRPSGRQRRDFRDSLIGWHSEHGRSFPWRNGTDPWRVLLAEICLHRTRAEQVVPVYEELCQIAPTPQATLAHADAVRHAMRSLGLRWRVDLLIDMARVIIESHGGQVPSTLGQLLSLPGVGDYVANAVLVFAFGENAILVDTNTTRIVRRVRGLTKVTRWHLRSEIYDLAGGTGADAGFNYALLDLAAIVCLPKTPRCQECAVRAHCSAYRSGLRS